MRQGGHAGHGCVGERGCVWGAVESWELGAGDGGGVGGKHVWTG